MQNNKEFLATEPIGKLLLKLAVHLSSHSLLICFIT